MSDSISARRRLRAEELPLIELSRCSLRLEGRWALREVSFRLGRGERWALLGPNGSGKTLLLKMLRGDVWPTPTGHERRSYGFGGVLHDEPAGSKEHIAYLGPERQDKYVRYGWDYPVAEVVATGLFDEDIPLNQPTRAQRARVERLLHRFGLWGLRERRMLSLSYGQRRLALVARAFAGSAPVLLLDEVFNGLDERAKHKLQRALEDAGDGHSWILSSHRPQELPASLTHVAHMRDGRIMAAGPVDATRLQAARPARAGQARSSAGRSRTSRSPTSLAVVSARATRPARAGADGWLVRIGNADLYRDYRPVIRGLNWTIERGEHWAVLGPNGSGKSTLLSLIHGDLHPALGGTIERSGVPFGTSIEDWKRRVGWVSPELQADHYLVESIEQVVISGRYAQVGLDTPPSAADRRAAGHWLRFFGIERLRERGPRQVSYGQMRLALLARAMIAAPQLLLLDEPCTGLDGEMREQVRATLERLAAAGTQIVMAVHDPADIVPSIRHVLSIGRGGRVSRSMLP